MTKQGATIIAEMRKQIDIFEAFEDGISFWSGSPGGNALHGCKDIVLEATNKLLKKDSDLAELFTYGETQGCKLFRNQLALYLGKEYGQTIDSNRLLITAGATHGLQLLFTILIQPPCPIFVEDPTYYFGFRMLRDDLSRTVVPVPRDDQGMRTDLLEQLLQKHKPADDHTTQERPYWAAVYLIPVFNNPTGVTYSAERCHQLVKLARKYGVLLIAEDIYNHVYYSDDAHQPTRLITYDNPSDPDYGIGHVISNTSFSKMLAPSLRLGWIEGPPGVISFLTMSNTAWSGGSFNHFAAKLVTEILRSGALEEHVDRLRKLYKKRMTLMYTLLRENLPKGCSFNKPQGGFFLLVELPSNINALQLVKFAMNSHKVLCMPGVCCSPTNGSENCLRISISMNNEEGIKEGARRLCQAITEYISDPSTETKD